MWLDWESRPAGTHAPLFSQDEGGKLLLSKMVSLFILVFASFALVRFAVSQWRAIWITTANQPLSEMLRTSAGIESESIGAQDFGALLVLCDNLSPDLKKKTPWLREVSVYYRAVSKLERVFRVKLPAISSWANREMQTCSRYVAVVLDQNLSMSLDRRLAARLN
jgi:hypothetical protein